jgi:enamine deaminase RidA (YjgF/YER057c/UK114 family)
VSTTGEVAHLNPDELTRSAAFTQAVLVEGPARTVYVGGQNGVDAQGTVLDGIAAQTAQALANVDTAARATGGTLHDVVKWTIYVVQGHDLREAFGAFQQAWGPNPDPPAIGVVVVRASPSLISSSRSRRSPRSRPVSPALACRHRHARPGRA